MTRISWRPHELSLNGRRWGAHADDEFVGAVWTLGESTYAWTPSISRAGVLTEHATMREAAEAVEARVRGAQGSTPSTVPFNHDQPIDDV